MICSIPDLFGCGKILLRRAVATAPWAAPVRLNPAVAAAIFPRKRRRDCGKAILFIADPECSPDRDFINSGTELSWFRAKWRGELKSRTELGNTGFTYSRSHTNPLPKPACRMTNS